jgi:hypothetical protein
MCGDHVGINWTDDDGFSAESKEREREREKKCCDIVRKVPIV